MYGPAACGAADEAEGERGATIATPAVSSCASSAPVSRAATRGAEPAGHRGTQRAHRFERTARQARGWRGEGGHAQSAVQAVRLALVLLRVGETGRAHGSLPTRCTALQARPVRARLAHARKRTRRPDQYMRVSLPDRSDGGGAYPVCCVRVGAGVIRSAPAVAPAPTPHVQSEYSA